MEPKLYDHLNKAWKSTCRILLGEEMGELREYEGWLKEYLPEVGRRQSHISGKETVLAMDDYCKDANFVSLDEMKEKSVSLNINEIKDIDSILESISENWEYCGYRVLGNSKFVESSDLVMDSQYVADSTNIQQSMNIFASTMIRMNSQYAFGSAGFGKGEFVIRSVNAFNIKRCFESHFFADCSDLYFCYNNFGCHDMMFSFGQKNKRHTIGNLPLQPENYLALKKKLLGEIADELKKNKHFPSLFEMVPDSKPDADIKLPMIQRNREENPSIIEKAFSSTLKVIFKKDINHRMDDCAEWLQRHTHKIKEVDSPFGAVTYAPDGASFTNAFSIFPKNRMVSYEEALELGKFHLNESDILSLEKIREKLGRIGYFTDETYEGNTHNCIRMNVAYNSSNSYRQNDASDSEYCGLGSWALHSKYAFGCHRIIESQFCAKCYNSMHLNRCLELDTCTNCSDSLFSHNSEGLSDSMFCWNAKSKRHAIGNTELPPEQYGKIKDAIVEQLADEIIQTKGLKYDIFNVGCVGSK